MQYKIIVDKQSRVNPSGEQREYLIDIEELRVKDNTYDSLIVTPDRAYVKRRLQLSEYNVLTELEQPKIEELGDLNIELFEKENYIYLIDMEGNKFYAEYVVKNDFTDTFVTSIEMNTAINQTAQDIMLSVNKKVNGEDFGTYIQQNAEAIKIAWNQISQYLKMEGIEGKATLNIYDKDNKILMSLSQDGQCFFDNKGNKIGTIGIVREENRDTLAFAMNVDWDNINESNSMAWGFFDKEGGFLPIFHLLGYYGEENSEYGGQLAVEGILFTENLELMHGITLANIGNFYVSTEKGDDVISVYNIEGTKGFNLAGGLFSTYTTNANKTGARMEGDLSCDNFTANGNAFFKGALYCDGRGSFSNIPKSDSIEEISGSSNSFISAYFKSGGSVYIYANSSDKNLKKNIKETKIQALNKIKKIKHRQFDWRANNEHQEIGYIAQEMQEIDKDFIHYNKFKSLEGEEKEDWQINILSVLATSTKAIQEQQEQIEELQEKDKQKEEIIQNLISRIETLEKEVLNGKN